MNKRLYLQVTYLATDLARSGWEFPDKIILPRWSMIIFLLISNLFFLLLQQLFFVESKQVLSRFGLTNYFQISIVVEINKRNQLKCGTEKRLLERPQIALNWLIKLCTCQFDELLWHFSDFCPFLLWWGQTAADEAHQSHCKQTGSLVTPQTRVTRYKSFKKCHLWRFKTELNNCSRKPPKKYILTSLLKQWLHIERNLNKSSFYLDYKTLLQVKMLCV